jgi:ribonuclease E
MDKKILIDAVNHGNIQVAVVENGRLEELEYTSNIKQLIKGNVYLAKVTRIEPSLQAAFIDFGDEKHGFIPFSEIHPDYYDVPGKHRATEQSEEDNSEEGNVEEVDSPKDDSAEDIDSPDDENYMEKVKRKNSERYKIQEVLKRNQILLVQAVKEVRGNKGAMFTTYISLAGKYCVVMPNCDTAGGISKRVTNIEDRKKLQKAFDEISDKGQLGFIIRTAGQGHTKAEIKTDYNCLVKIWNNIREKTLSATAPAFIYAEDDILKKVVRDLYDKDTKEIVVQGDEAYTNLLETIKLMALTKYVKVNKYNGKSPIFNAFRIDEQLAALYSPVVQLKSGAYIVINPTEALTAIDVNSGRSTSERNVEETALKTNLEAAREIARQVRLRSISGLIVVDFIDMFESRNRSYVERTFRDFLRKDKAKIQVGHISNFGLLEMSRQLIKPSFAELNTVPCPHCKGRGFVKSDATNATMILRTIEKELSYNNNIKQLKVYLSSQMALFILNYKREDLKELEDRYQISILVMQDLTVGSDSFAMETVNRDRPLNPKPESNHNPNKQHHQPKAVQEARTTETPKAAAPHKGKNEPSDNPVKQQPAANQPKGGFKKKKDQPKAVAAASPKPAKPVKPGKPAAKPKEAKARKLSKAVQDN